MTQHASAPVRVAPEAAAVMPHVLREYALIADGERGALVGPRGDISWLCFPGWSDGAVFAALIGGDSSYRVTPDGRFVWGGHYEPGSLIWRSRWVTESGVVESREALARPSKPDRAVVLRRVHAEQSPATVHVVLDPRADFDGPRLSEVRRDEQGTWTGRLGDCWLRWSGAPEAEVGEARDDVALRLRLRIEPGQQRDLVLELSRRPFEDAPPAADMLWRATESTWQRGIPELGNSAAPRDARHSYAVLCGLTTSGGGTVAAATTSLPERAERGRNYDYRYVWCRDQSYIGQAAAAAGSPALLDASVAFVRDRLLADGDRLMPAYTASGMPVPDQREHGLPGYPGGSDMVGNHVNRQFQLDAFGEALLLFAAADRAGRLDEPDWRAAMVAAEAIERRWQEPDAGIWEIEPRAWTHSRLMCAAGLRQVSKLQRGHHLAGRWLALADRIVADTATHALHHSGRWQRAPDDARVDASLLLPAIRGAVPAQDPRSLATLQAVKADLTEDGYVYRFQQDARPLGDAEGAFLLCGFWMALTEQKVGNSAKAMRWFDRNRAACGPPGLLSEEFDVAQRQLRGNLPQAFVHALLLETACALGTAPAADM